MDETNVICASAKDIHKLLDTFSSAQLMTKFTGEVMKGNFLDVGLRGMDNIMLEKCAFWKRA